MTDLNIQLNDDVIVKLAIEATKQDVTLSRYIELIANEHVDNLNTLKKEHTEKKEHVEKRKPPVVEIVEDDVDERKKQAQQKSAAIDDKKSQPLYNKREKNTWKIW